MRLLACSTFVIVFLCCMITSAKRLKSKEHERNSAVDCTRVQEELNSGCTVYTEPSMTVKQHGRVTGTKKEHFWKIGFMQNLIKQTGMSRKEVKQCMQQLNEADCSDDIITCESDTYSTIDGTCNNLEHPHWGAVNTAYLRDLTSNYDDGIGSLRRATDGSDLPSPRSVSNTVHSQNIEQFSSVYSRWAATFGQMVAHDVVKTPVIAGMNGNSIDCCDESTLESCQLQCLPINVTGDPHFSQVGQTCINFVRSVAEPCCDLNDNEKCERNQLNVLSAYVDATATYGDDATVLAKLRDGAKLKVGEFVIEEGLHYLPGTSDPDACRDGTMEHPCYLAGDSRVSVAPSLQAAITAFMREHNRAVNKLIENNPTWDDEKLFQEARKILIAEMQHFTFSHYMETVLGEGLAEQYGLKEKDGHDNVYDDSVNAAIANNFATAAFRFGHSLGTSIQSQHKQQNNQEMKTFQLADNFFRVKSSYHENGIDGFMRFLHATESGGEDAFLTEAFRNELFKDLATSFSMDLASLNIQRGRDHGLPGYNEWKAWCDQDPFPVHHTTEMVDRIRSVYRNDADIDLFTGALSEIPVDGAIVGPLFGCLIGRQFRRLKNGDRYYFQNKPDATTMKGRFTEAQVRSIQQFTLSRLICENTETKFVQKNIFRTKSSSNLEVQCDKMDEAGLPDIDFTLWAE